MRELQRAGMSSGLVSSETFRSAPVQPEYCGAVQGRCQLSLGADEVTQELQHETTLHMALDLLSICSYLPSILPKRCRAAHYGLPAAVTSERCRFSGILYDPFPFIFSLLRQSQYFLVRFSLLLIYSHTCLARKSKRASHKCTQLRGLRTDEGPCSLSPLLLHR